ARNDQRKPHHDRADDAIEEHAVLGFGRNLEIGEDQRDDEYVVERQRLFDEIAGQEFRAALLPLEIEDAGRKQHSQRNVAADREKRLTGGYYMVLAVQDEEIEKQDNGDERQETGPKPVMVKHGCGFSVALRWRVVDRSDIASDASPARGARPV